MHPLGFPFSCLPLSLFPPPTWHHSGSTVYLEDEDSVLDWYKNWLGLTVFASTECYIQPCWCLKNSSSPSGVMSSSIRCCWCCKLCTSSGLTSSCAWSTSLCSWARWEECTWKTDSHSLTVTSAPRTCFIECVFFSTGGAWWTQRRGEWGGRWRGGARGRRGRVQLGAKKGCDQLQTGLAG